jgi:hypothetical protein
LVKGKKVKGERLKEVSTMLNLLKKHAPDLNSILLILMLAIPFLLYYFARAGSDNGVIIFLAIMGAVMLMAMKR